MHHIASPFPGYAPRDEQELIRPAVEGTLRVLKAARDAGTVRRVVLTSSFAAIGYGAADGDGDGQGKVYTEADWTEVEGEKGRGVGAYQKSKTMAERAAWGFMREECGDANGNGGKMELAVVNPVAVFGPVLDAGATVSTSVSVVQKMLNGTAPMVPQLQFGIVDVRDVAALHVLCMTHPKAAGERFLAVTGEPMWLREIAAVLKERLDAKWAWWVPTKEVPNWVVKLAAYGSSMMAMVAGEVGRTKLISGDKAVQVLGWKPRSREDAVMATAESLIALGIV